MSVLSVLETGDGEFVLPISNPALQCDPLLTAQ